MKKHLPLFFLFCALAACEDPDREAVPDAIDPPPSSGPITGNLMVYAIDNSQQANPLYVSANNAYLDYSKSSDGFSIDNVTLDKHYSKLTASVGLTANYPGFDTHKIFTAISTTKNYVNLKQLYPALAGNLNRDYDNATIDLPKDGQLVVPAYSFGQHSGVEFYIRASYLRPSDKDYVVSLPCYPLVEENGKKIYLNSFGTYLLRTEAKDNAGDNVDFDPTAKVFLKFPIPPDIAGSRLDSIETWTINSQTNRWKRSGYAVKVDNYYQAKINREGFWSIAIPTEGVYVTLQLTTTTGAPVANTRFTLKSGQDEIAEGRSNTEGKALVFVPARRDLTMDVIYDHFGYAGYTLTSLPLGNFNTSTTEKTVTLPDDGRLTNLEGNILNCDGSPFGNGSAVLSISFAKDVYAFPIKNGHFTAAQWVMGGGYHGGTLEVRDGAGNPVVSYPVTLSSPNGTAKKYNVNFYTCANANQLYCNYTIDANNYKISRDVNASGSSFALSAIDPVFHKINIGNNDGGVSFNVWFTTDGVAYISANGLTVNGTPCEYDYTNGKSEIYLTKNDPVAGGFLEGWFSIGYKDGNHALHTITGNFRIKRM